MDGVDENVQLVPTEQDGPQLCDEHGKVLAAKDEHHLDEDGPRRLSNTLGSGLEKRGDFQEDPKKTNREENHQSIFITETTYTNINYLKNRW